MARNKNIILFMHTGKLLQKGKHKSRFHPFKRLSTKLFYIEEYPTENTKTLKMERAPRTRDCSWENSSSSSVDSSDSEYEANSHGTHQPQPQIIHDRRVLRMPFQSEELEPHRPKWRKCLLGFLHDVRRYSTDYLQNCINREWGTSKSATVMGRSGNHYVISFDTDYDMGWVTQEGPWSFDGAFFFTEPWTPNQPVTDRPMQRIEIWVELWGLPLAYQQPEAAKKIAKAAGEYGQVEEMINQQIREATERVDMPCVTIPNINQFTAEMKAYNRRRSRRNTRFYYLGDGNDGAGTSQQGAAIGARRGFTTVPTTPTHSPPTDLQHQTRSENLEVPNINTVTTQTLNPLEFLTQNQTLNHRENPNLLAQDTPLTKHLLNLYTWKPQS
ncbi:hypothetical protein COLO4_19176 [Corchorus olitorius]|uniref:DUF4283 domain-containing protein n=1 Tax=Corchorus olitorius TaxID=93759 RepID=A0A1R3J6H5_9ROSI|nr:hypothetical protein COLO4_19176 [Corchorus olitorius]